MSRAISLVGLLLCATVLPSAAQREAPPRTFLVNVTPRPARFTGGPNDHLLTFSTKVEVPGANLVAGTYVFRSLGTSAVQVMTADPVRVITTFLALRDDGEGDTSRDRIKFQRMDDDGLRIVAWYPADAIGYEFLYTKPKRESVDRRER